MPTLTHSNSLYSNSSSHKTSLIHNTLSLKDILLEQDSYESMWIHRSKALHLPRLKYGFHAIMLDSNNRDSRFEFSSTLKTVLSLPNSNRSIQLTWDSKYSSLIFRAKYEINWFIENQFEDLIQSQRCGVNGLIMSLQKIYYDQLRSSWCPYIFRSLDNRRQELFNLISSLGSPVPPKLDYSLYKVYFSYYYSSFNYFIFHNSF